MALKQRGKRDDDEGRNEPPPTPAGPEPPPVAELVMTLRGEDGQKEEISRVAIPPHEFFGMKANATYNRLGPAHPETLLAFRQYTRALGARISISARQRGVGGSLRYDPVSGRPRCRSC
ncbi:hypothetical protein ACFXI6_46405, partial [Streptomyces mirabilis]|uniref:hypothetical protein n=1 Tax=Streptomyces mirabilis TaxID=68239 RepID=UPI0036AF2C6E